MRIMDATIKGMENMGVRYGFSIIGKILYNKRYHIDLKELHIHMLTTGLFYFLYRFLYNLLVRYLLFVRSRPL